MPVGRELANRLATMLPARMAPAHNSRNAATMAAGASPLPMRIDHYRHRNQYSPDLQSVNQWRDEQPWVLGNRVHSPEINRVILSFRSRPNTAAETVRTKIWMQYSRQLWKRQKSNRERAGRSEHNDWCGRLPRLGGTPR